MNSSHFKSEHSIDVADKILYGYLDVPQDALGVVIFAHGSGSSRHSPRNQAVAVVLQEARIGTLLVDLLTLEEEEQDLLSREYRFDIALLADRLVLVTHWLASHPALKALPRGYFGSSTGAAAALVAAVEAGQEISAIVSRGGRPDLATASLQKVAAPTMLIVGSEDYAVIDLNRGAYALMNCPKKLEIIPNATHLFEEHGALEEVAALAKLWFIHYFSKQE